MMSDERDMDVRMMDGSEKDEERGEMYGTPGPSPYDDAKLRSCT